MSQQNLVEQFRLFMEYARKNAMHSRECMLWLSLLYLANEEATYNAESQTYEWPDGFFEISNGELNSYGKFDKQAVESLRNRLKQRNLIDFVKGNRNAAAPMYRIHYLVMSGNKIIPKDYSKEHTKEDANHIPKPQAKEDANPQANLPPIRSNYNNNNYNNYNNPEEEEELQRARAEVESAWNYCFGRKPTPIIVNELAKRVMCLEFGDGILNRAIRLAAMKEAESPMDYVLTVLADWHENGVLTEQDLDEYMALHDMQQGKFGPGMAMAAGDRIEEFRARMAAKA